LGVPRDAEQNRRANWDYQGEQKMKISGLLTMSSALIILVALAMPVASGQDIVKVAPHKCKVLLDNDRVRVIEVVNEPGGKVPMHSHPPYIAYALTSGTEKLTSPDGKVVINHIKAGHATWSNGATHTGQNIGKSEIRVLLIELKK
jgi:beta-alanine degradation protein BauB